MRLPQVDSYASGSYAFVGGFASGLQAVWESGLQVFDISDPADSVLAGSVDTPDHALGIHVAGSHADVADGSDGLHVAAGSSV